MSQVNRAHESKGHFGKDRGYCQNYFFGPNVHLKPFVSATYKVNFVRSPKTPDWVLLTSAQYFDSVNSYSVH